ncbi:serine hydrolase domain-containing protein [Halorubellus litoreus]|uniref:Serine hydrolase domain-containing protein n=1 Tax=Halorubellus litoreus TaxID=755308 RepID=A0ABD5VM56_9EURY
MVGRRSRRRLLQSLGGTALTATLAGCTNLGGNDHADFHRPTTGDRVPELDAIDDAMQSFMVENEVPGGTLGVAKDGTVVFERGYGHSDPLQTAPVRPDATFRIASITKSFTAAVVRSLVDDGELAMDDRPFQILDLAVPESESRTEGLDDITVSHLLEHEGGWDYYQSGFMPTFEQFAIANALDLDRPATSRDIVRYMLARPLQFEPGEKSVYSNFGYLVLSVLVERATGQSFPEAVRSICFDGDVSNRLYEGSTLPADRPEREVAYHSNGHCPNAMTLEEYDTVPCADGGYPIESVGGAGELVTNTRTLLSFSDDYTTRGEPRGDADPGLTAFGSIPGAHSMLHQRGDGVDVAVLFNARGRTTGAYDDIKSTLNDAIGNVDDWP